MSLILDPANQLTVTALQAGAIAANGNGAAIDLQPYKGRVAVVLVTSAGTGTSPVLASKLQDSPDNTNWTDVANAAFTNVANAAGVQVLSYDTRAGQRYLRAPTFIGGTNTPTIPATITVLGEKERY